MRPSLSSVTHPVHHHQNWIEIRGGEEMRDELEGAKGRSGNEFSGSITTRTREANGLHSTLRPRKRRQKKAERTSKHF
jgi:hypothetical protein